MTVKLCHFFNLLSLDVPSLLTAYFSYHHGLNCMMEFGYYNNITSKYSEDATLLHTVLFYIIHCLGIAIIVPSSLYFKCVFKQLLNI